jgi:hypothetical protein
VAPDAGSAITHDRIVRIGLVSNDIDRRFVNAAAAAIGNEICLQSVR